MVLIGINLMGLLAAPSPSSVLKNITSSAGAERRHSRLYADNAEIFLAPKKLKPDAGGEAVIESEPLGVIYCVEQ
jgi:hypothetical protein